MVDKSLLPSSLTDYTPEQCMAIIDKYVSFFVTGVTGVLLNLVLTWLFTTLLFGVQNYFYAYLIGLSANLLYNFLRHSMVTFDTSGGHGFRFMVFILYSLCMAGLQALTVREVVSLVGESYYLVVIATVIFLFSTVTFIVCNYWLFSDDYF